MLAVAGCGGSHSLEQVEAGLSASAATRGALQAARLEASSCGRFGDSLSALVTERDLHPGGRSDPVRLCLRNTGTRAGAVQLSLQAFTDVEVSCGSLESEVDASCEPGAQGEAGDVLDQLVAVDSRCTSSASTETRRSLRVLRDQPLVLVPHLDPGVVTCVAVRVEHAAGPTSPSGTAARRAQTDLATWNYLFSLQPLPQR